MRSQGVSLSKESFEFHTASAVLGFSMKFLGGFCKLPSLQLIIMINKMDVEGSLRLLAAEMIMPTIIYRGYVLKHEYRVLTYLYYLLT